MHDMNDLKSYLAKQYSSNVMFSDFIAATTIVKRVEM